MVKQAHAKSQSLIKGFMLSPPWLAGEFQRVFGEVNRAIHLLTRPSDLGICPSLVVTSCEDRGYENPWQYKSQTAKQLTQQRLYNSMNARDAVLSAAHALHNLRNLMDYLLRLEEQHEQAVRRQNDNRAVMASAGRSAVVALVSDAVVHAVTSTAGGSDGGERCEWTMFGSPHAVHHSNCPLDNRNAHPSNLFSSNHHNSPLVHYDTFDWAGRDYPDRIATNLACLGIVGYPFKRLKVEDPTIPVPKPGPHPLGSRGRCTYMSTEQVGYDFHFLQLG